jgi:hypothetical protein
MPGTGDLRSQVYDAALARREPYTASCIIQMAGVSASNLERVADGVRAEADRFLRKATAPG